MIKKQSLRSKIKTTKSSNEICGGKDSTMSDTSEPNSPIMARTPASTLAPIEEDAPILRINTMNNPDSKVDNFDDFEKELMGTFKGGMEIVKVNPLDGFDKELKKELEAEDDESVPNGEEDSVEKELMAEVKKTPTPAMGINPMALMGMGMMNMMGMGKKPAGGVAMGGMNMFELMAARDKLSSVPKPTTTPAEKPVVKEATPVIKTVPKQETPVIKPVVKEETPAIKPVVKEETPVIKPLVKEKIESSKPVEQTEKRKTLDTPILNGLEAKRMLKKNTHEGQLINQEISEKIEEIRCMPNFNAENQIQNILKSVALPPHILNDPDVIKVSDSDPLEPIPPEVPISLNKFKVFKA